MAKPVKTPAKQRYSVLFQQTIILPLEPITHPTVVTAWVGDTVVASRLMTPEGHDDERSLVLNAALVLNEGQGFRITSKRHEGE